MPKPPRVLDSGNRILPHPFPAHPSMPDTPSIIESPALQKSPRISRLRLLVALVLIMTVAGVFVVRHLESRARSEIYAEFLSNQGQETHRALEGFYRPIARLLQLIPQWGKSGVVTFDEPERVRDHFVPMLAAQDGVVALSIVGHAGRSYELRREGDNWRGSLFHPEELDRRQRRWYALATRKDMLGKVVITELPVPLTQGEPHLLAALAWQYTENDTLKTGAASLEMSSAATRELAERLAISEGSVVILMGKGDVVSWLTPGDERHLQAAPIGRLSLSDEPLHQLIARALASWGEHGQAYEQNFSVRQQEREYLLRFLEVEAGATVHSMALIVPRADLDERLNVLTRPFLYALLAVMLLGMLVVALLYYFYRRRIRELKSRGEHTRLSEAGLRALIDRGESDRLEFKSTLRWNLKANKPGKEIEMAWLKTLVAYLNTEGGTLLVGVADDGSIGGLDQDGFKNEDKYLLHFNNSVKQHIGIEFARFLSFDIRPIEGKQILVVDVRKADGAAFLVREDEEEFYVRVGPASRKVSPRKALEYLRDRD